MKEASKAKYFLAKYFFLSLGLLQWLVSGMMLVRSSERNDFVFAALVFFALGLISFSIQALIANKLKRVALGKKKVAVIERAKTKSYKWPDVKSIRLIPFFNIYSMKLKGRKDKIYFLSTKSAPSVYGMFAANEFSDKAKN